MRITRISVFLFLTFSVLGLGYVRAQEDEETTTKRTKKSRTTPATSPKPSHAGEHKLMNETEGELHETTTLPSVTKKPKPVTKKTAKPKAATKKPGKKSTTTVSPKKSEDQGEDDKTVDKLLGRGVKGRGVAAAAAGSSGADPFSQSREWTMFNRKMDNMTVILIEMMKPAFLIFTDKNEDYKANKTGFLDSFIENFNEKYLLRLVELLRPAHEELIRNEAFTIVNPAIGLRTIAEGIAFAKTNPAEDNDKGRLKWLEVNSMAATIHYIYKRLIPNLRDAGLKEVNRTMGINYPSWVTDFVIKENENSFQDLNAANLTAYIHEQMNILGDPNHLIRILERLLNKTALSDWDPSKTPLNMYCYGNNRNGQIHTKFDVLLDAALYLCLADMKFAILEMVNSVYMAWELEKAGNDEKLDLESRRNEIETTLKTRLERKYRIAPELGNVNVETAIAPKKFKCDQPPAQCGEAPHETAPNCPPGVYIQDGAVFKNGTKLVLPENPSDGISDNGKRIDCIGLEFVPFDENGFIVPCNLKDGKCVDPVTGSVLENLKVTLSPVLLDENRVPIHRDNRLLSYPKSSEWGIMDCRIHPDPPTLDPPHGDVPGETGRDPASPAILGYEDPRKPNMTETAQFFNAFPAYLESELVLSPEGKCIGTCRNYKNPTPTCTNKTTHCDLYRKSHCEDPTSDCMKASKCPNHARRCIRTSREVNFCPANEGSGRVYDWLKFNDKIRRAGVADLANSSSEEDTPGCDGDRKVVKLRERWEMESGVILNTPEYCEVCLCVCADPMSPDGQHYFDIAPRNADIANGFVVTGLRFEQKNNIMSLNIQHGKLLANGEIDASSVTWLEPNETPEPVPLGTGGFFRMNLDEIHARFTEVVTGVKWKLESARSLSLEIGVTEFKSKVLDSSSKIEFISATTEFAPSRQRFDLTESNSPFNQAGPSQPYPITDESKYYIEFDANSLEDGGQAVVPFFDKQEIQFHPPVPLSSVGILYKSKKGFGGFLATSLRAFVHPYLRELL